MIEQNSDVQQLREAIAGLPEDDQFQIEAIAMTLRNILKADVRAKIAFALIGAELAAAEEKSP